MRFSICSGDFSCFSFFSSLKELINTFKILRSCIWFQLEIVRDSFARVPYIPASLQSSIERCDVLNSPDFLSRDDVLQTASNRLPSFKRHFLPLLLFLHQLAAKSESISKCLDYF